MDGTNMPNNPTVLSTTKALYIAKYHCIFETNSAMATFKQALLAFIKSNPQVSIMDEYYNAETTASIGATTAAGTPKEINQIDKPSE